jgi:hypothetical protein
MSGPKDQTLNAYKAWIRDIARRLTTEKSSIKLTEAEWAAYWTGSCFEGGEIAEFVGTRLSSFNSFHPQSAQIERPAVF